MKKYSMSITLLTVKNNSQADMRTSHTQLLEQGCQHGDEDSKNKILLYKEYITGEKSNNISILPACRLSVHREANYNASTGQSFRYE